MSPRAACAPMFRALAGPARPPVDSTLAPKRRATSAESSVDPSSTTINSSGPAGHCARWDRETSRCLAAL